MKTLLTAKRKLSALPMRSLFLLSAATFIFQSCGELWHGKEPTPAPQVISRKPSEEVLNSYDYGEMSDAKALRLLKAWGNRNFRDPYSTKYQITHSPRKGWGAARRLYLYGDDDTTGTPGWLFRATTNSKNGYGAYSGGQNHVYLITDGRVKRLSYYYPQYNATVGTEGYGTFFGYR